MRGGFGGAVIVQCRGHKCPGFGRVGHNGLDAGTAPAVAEPHLRAAIGFGNFVEHYAPAIELRLAKHRIEPLKHSLHGLRLHQLAAQQRAPETDQIVRGADDVPGPEGRGEMELRLRFLGFAGMR